MLIKSIIIFLVSLTVVLIISYFIFEEAIKEIFFPSLEICSEVCVRFCCSGSYFCDDKTNFDVSNISEAIQLRENYRVLKGKPCDQLYEESENWGFLSNGYIYDNYNITYDWNNYCISVNGTNKHMFICAPQEKVDKIKLLYPYFMIASIPFLVITFFVYACIKELRNSHGKSLMAYVFSLTLIYGILSLLSLYDRYFVENYNILCKMMGYTLMTATFMCFFWLNVMCYDIWSTFKGKGIKKDESKFYLYCGFAIGFPIFLASIACILNEFEVLHNDYSTKIGTSSCTVTHDLDDEGEIIRTRQLIYIYAPTIIFIVINTIFYSITAYKIYRVQKETSIVKRGESSRHAKKEKARFLLYLRLFVIMGIPWSIEIFSWYTWNSIILHAASTINCLQGFIIFMMFVWQPKVEKAIERHYTTMSKTVSIISSRRSNATKTESLSFDESKKN
ncbi:hypothetical protein PVAND_010799 [Polypedilum vanderplanki]|uniref:G-protein coupled receptors family 2 profile 2 domain-containing protein n=1 Tax=Polypedilum vanderplanki TaxID=319348 RepID=A0A9J6CHY2_POLVA|nr:hypothetical protein PVAND_010799 [Polypedilum vanderplanki]